MTEKNKSLLEKLIISGVILLFTLLNTWQVIYFFLTRTSNIVFIGISHYYEDYFYYLSIVAQGARGSLLTRNMYTTENIEPVAMWLPNLILGKVGNIIGLQPWDIYSWSVILVSALSLITLAWASGKLNPTNRTKRLSTFLIAVTSSMFYKLVHNPDGTDKLIPYEFFYNYTASLNRLGGVFHLILQNILSLLTVFWAAELLEYIFNSKSNKKAFIIRSFCLSLCIFILMFINPVYILIDGICVFVVFAFYAARHLRKLVPGRLFFATSITITPSLLPAYLLYQAFRLPFYQYFQAWEASVLKTHPETFVRSMGLVGILALVGSIRYLYLARSLLHKIGFIWAVLPIIIYFSPLPAKLHLPAFRLLQPPSYIILAAMATEALYLPGALLRKLKIGKLVPYVYWSLISVFVLIQIPAIRYEFNQRMNNYILPSWMNNLPIDYYQGFLFLKNQPPGNSISIGSLELFIPVMSDKTVYVGHNSLTLAYDWKINQAVRLFTRRMTPEEAGQFLRSNSIIYLVNRTGDDPEDLLSRQYPFLTPIFKNTGLRVYRVN